MNIRDLPETPPDTLMATLDIRILELTLERVVASMPVTAKVHQPYGLLHGGASVALAETVASIGATLSASAEGKVAVGQEINANHLRSKRDGTLTATATPLHKGRASHVWSVEIRDEAGALICISRCTLAVIDAR